MNEPPIMTLEALKIITEFVSDNLVNITIIFLLFICKDAISSFISRLTSLTYKTSKSEIDMKAVAPCEEKDRGLRTADEKPTLEYKDSEIDKKGELWFPDMHKAFDEGRLEDAESAFKKYALNETDEIQLAEHKAFYLYLRFEKGQDNLAIDELEQLALTAKTEESKFNTLTWLSFCLRDGMQHHKEIEMWRSVMGEIQSAPLKTKAIVNLAYVLNKEEASAEAKKLLTDRLLISKDDAQKASLYQALSEVEDSCGNKFMSIYCKDKSLEFDLNNRDELFNSAYAASDENIDEISISNYIRLIRIDGDNSTALNNLGVRAQEAGLKIKAIDQYKKSSKHNNTLAMANQGYLLLGAGFTDEAKEIANRAIAQGDPHQNVHSLLAEINARKEKEDSDWEDLGKKALSRQKIIREYTEKFYLGNSKLLEGTWYARGTYPTIIKIKDTSIQASWIETAGVLGGGTYTVEFAGQVSGSTIDGTYTRKRNESSPNTLLGLAGNTAKACIGYFSEKDRGIRLFSKELKDDFSLCLSHKKV